LKFEEEETDITEIELEMAIQTIKLGKAVDHDISLEMVKYMGKAGKTVLFNIIKSARKYKKMPKDWRTSIISFKKWDTRLCLMK
jgi:hypothetical protein